MPKKAKPKHVQAYNPQTKRWVKIETRTGRIVGRKRTPGAYKDIPKRKTMLKTPKPVAAAKRKTKTTTRKKPATGRKTKYTTPKKIRAMVYGTSQSTLREGTTKTAKKRTVKKPDRKPDVTPTKIKDVGRANVKTQIMRIKCEKLEKLPKVSTPDIAADILDGMALNDREEVRVLYMNGENRIIGVETAHIGAVNSSVCSPHEVYKTALLLNATGVILAHNHPTGNPKPSSADLINTRQFQEAGKTLGIKLLDSIIIGNGKYYSLQQEGHLA